MLYPPSINGYNIFSSFSLVPWSEVYNFFILWLEMYSGFIGFCDSRKYYNFYNLINDFCTDFFKYFPTTE